MPHSCPEKVLSVISVLMKLKLFLKRKTAVPGAARFAKAALNRFLATVMVPAAAFISVSSTPPPLQTLSVTVIGPLFPKRMRRSWLMVWIRLAANWPPPSSIETPARK